MGKSEKDRLKKKNVQSHIYPNAIYCRDRGICFIMSDIVLKSLKEP